MQSPRSSAVNSSQIRSLKANPAASNNIDRSYGDSSQELQVMQVPEGSGRVTAQLLVTNPNHLKLQTEMMMQTRESKSTFPNNKTSKRTNTIFDNSRGTYDNHSSASFLFENQTKLGLDTFCKSQIQQNDPNDTTLRSSSLTIRAKKEGIGYKDGFIRLLEHDKHSASSEQTDYRAHFSFIDDPTLEINQM